MAILQLNLEHCPRQHGADRALNLLGFLITAIGTPTLTILNGPLVNPA